MENLTNIITPYKGKNLNLIQQYRNFKLSQIRILIEHINEKLKIFQILCEPWRHDLDLHQVIFTVICNLINLEFQIHPAHQE